MVPVKTSMLNIICGSIPVEDGQYSASVEKILPKKRNIRESAALDVFIRTRLWEPVLL